MSRTKRKHWLREEMRDGVKRPHIKTKKKEESMTKHILNKEIESDVNDVAKYFSAGEEEEFQHFLSYSGYFAEDEETIFKLRSAFFAAL